VRARSSSTSKKRRVVMDDQLIKLLKLVSGQPTEPERLARLNDEQRAIVLKRDEKRLEREKLIDSLQNNNDPDVHEHVFNQLRDLEEHECEHGRHYVKHCLACGAIDHLMYPEYFDEDGFPLEDSEEVDDTDDQ
jgi:hypothetical protein